jgi:hypothetical protein
MKLAVFNKADDTFWGYASSMSSVNTSVHYVLPYNPSNDPTSNAAYYTAQKSSATQQGNIDALRASTASPAPRKDITTRSGNGTTANSDRYVRFTGNAAATETIPSASGSGREVTYKNSSTYNWTLSHSTSTMDGTTSFILAPNQSITVIDVAQDKFDIF